MNTHHKTPSRATQFGLSGIGKLLLVVLIALVAVFGYRKYTASQLEKRQASARTEVQEAQKRLLTFSNRWGDASRLASSTSRIALSGPVATLQQLQREPGEIPVPKCLEQGRKHLAEAIRLEVESFLTFMSDTETSGKIKAIELRTESSEQSAQFIKAGLDPNACAAFISAGGN